MSLTQTNHRQSEQGFTLVELAIVMVIIGLLIGGILKGQELIANAKISSTVSQLKGLDAAMNTFEDKYNAKPGLMTDALTRLPGCVAPCANGTGTVYGTTLAPPTNLTDPGALVFVHLSAADLISGIDPSGTTPVTFGKALPTVKAGGGMWIGTPAAATGLGAGTTLSVGRPYAVLNGSVATPGAATGVLSATASAQIDRKLDDGQPLSGAVQTTGTNCVTAGSPAVYSEGNTASTCSMASRVLN